MAGALAVLLSRRARVANRRLGLEFEPPALTVAHASRARVVESCGHAPSVSSEVGAPLVPIAVGLATAGPAAQCGVSDRVATWAVANALGLHITLLQFGLPLESSPSGRNSGHPVRLPELGNCARPIPVRVPARDVALRRRARAQRPGWDGAIVSLRGLRSRSGSPPCSGRIRWRSVRTLRECFARARGLKRRSCDGRVVRSTVHVPFTARTLVRAMFEHLLDYCRCVCSPLGSGVRLQLNPVHLLTSGFDLDDRCVLRVFAALCHVRTSCSSSILHLDYRVLRF